MEDKKKRPPQQALASSSPVNQGKDSNPSELPVVFTAALNVLNNYLDTEGIFRISGSVKEVENLKSRAEKAGRNGVAAAQAELTAENNPHNVSGVLKLYIRTMPAPVLSFELYEFWRELAKTLLPLPGKAPPPESSTDLFVAAVRAGIGILPRYNQILLAALLPLLSRVAARAAENKMSPANLSIVFSPSMLRPQTETLETLLADSEPIHSLTAALISHGEQFADVTGVQFDLPAGLPPAVVEAFNRGRVRLSQSLQPRSASPPGSSRVVAPSPKEQTPQDRAATLIQRVYKGWKQRRRMAALPSRRYLLRFNCAFLELCRRQREHYATLLEIGGYTSLLRAAELGQTQVISASEVRSIFCNGAFEMMLDCERQLLSDLERCASAWPRVQNVGQTILSCLRSPAFVQAAELYFANYEMARKTLLFVEKSRSAMWQFLETMQARSDKHLRELLQAPLQRFSQLQRDIARLVEVALLEAEGAEERKEQWRLLEAFVLAGRLARAVVALQEAEQHAALVMIEKVIEGAKEAEFLVRRGRRLVRRGDVTIASEKRYMFLFNDLCLVAKPDSKGINYQFKYVVELSRASLEESPRAKHPEVTFDLQTVDRPYQIVCRNSAEKMAWMQDLKNVLSRLHRDTFGRTLPELLAREGKAATEHALPALLERLIRHLSSLQPPPAGLFVLPADDYAVEALKSSLDRLDSPNQLDLSNSDPHAIAAVLRLFLDELPDPLLALPANNKPLPPLFSDPPQYRQPDAKAFLSFLRSLSPPSKAFLTAICSLAASCVSPRFTLRMLALSLSSSLIRLPSESPRTALDPTIATFSHQFSCVLLENYALLLSPPQQQDVPLLLSTSSLEPEMRERADSSAAAQSQVAGLSAALSAVRPRKPLPLAPGKPLPAPPTSSTSSGASNNTTPSPNVPMDDTPTLSSVSSARTKPLPVPPGAKGGAIKTARSFEDTNPPPGADLTPARSASAPRPALVLQRAPPLSAQPPTRPQPSSSKSPPPSLSKSPPLNSSLSASPPPSSISKSPPRLAGYSAPPIPPRPRALSPKQRPMQQGAVMDCPAKQRPVSMIISGPRPLPQPPGETASKVLPRVT